LNLALRHEIGHLLGLAHVCDPNPAGSTTQRNDRGIPVARCGASPEAVQLALMAPGADVAMPRSTQTAFVGPDEVSALCRIYPAPRSAFRRYPLTLALLLAIWVVVFVWRRQRAQP
jgi:hypothetical protein